MRKIIKLLARGEQQAATKDRLPGELTKLREANNGLKTENGEQSKFKKKRKEKTEVENKKEDENKKEEKKKDEEKKRSREEAKRVAQSGKPSMNQKRR